MNEELSTFNFLRLVAGELCPCGHDSSSHEEPVEEYETFGACGDDDCDCKGLVDFGDDFDES